MHQLRLRPIRSYRTIRGTSSQTNRGGTPREPVRTPRKILRFRQEPLHDNFQGASLQPVAQRRREAAAMAVAKDPTPRFCGLIDCEEPLKSNEPAPRTGGTFEPTRGRHRESSAD